MQQIAIVIDDNVDIAEVVGVALQLCGLDYKAYTTFSEALPHVNRLSPCIAFIDLHVPDSIQIKEFIARLRENHPNIPIFIMTGDPKADQKIDGLAVSGQIRKPFDLDDVIQVASQHCLKNVS